MEFAILLVIIVVGIVICGFVGFIISLNLISKLKTLEQRLDILSRKTQPPKPASQPQPKPQPAAPQTPPQPKPSPKQQPLSPHTMSNLKANTDRAYREPPKPAPIKTEAQKPFVPLEQKIGTRWILVAGIITVLVGVGFFLKYAYDNSLIGPMGRVTIAAISGIIVLAVGEFTRRKNFELVAKGVTSLGFAILYAADFSAYRFYELIDPAPAFIIAIMITAAAMLYAISLNEIVVAILALIGGYLTPILLSTGQNTPISLFIYLFILGLGAILCAYYRKWRAVNCIAFLGTFALYAGWFESFYRDHYHPDITPTDQFTVALAGLSVFFIMFMVLPILNSLIKKQNAQKEDVLLILANAIISFFYYWSILFEHNRTALAFTAVGMCIAHLFMLSIATRRCKDDINLRLSLLVIGLFFVTIAIPLYFKLYAVAIAWSVETAVLSFIGLKYKSPWTKLAGAIAIILAIGQLCYHLPLHYAAFRFILNPAFGTWAFVSLAILAAHLLYRLNFGGKNDSNTIFSQISYTAALIILLIACVMEWFAYIDYNINANEDSLCFQGLVILASVFIILLSIRPVKPQGTFPVFVASIASVMASLIIIFIPPDIYRERFTIFANMNFIASVILIASIFAGTYFINKQKNFKSSGKFAFFLGLLATIVLWIIITEQIYSYFYCKDRYLTHMTNWQFLAHMYVSISWAIYAVILMTVGFAAKLRSLRYISLGLFALLLLKVFILDTSEVKNVYRIAAFLVTGVTLVAVSYLYQYLKNKGYFDNLILNDKTEE